MYLSTTPQLHQGHTVVPSITSAAGKKKLWHEILTVVVAKEEYRYLFSFMIILNENLFQILLENPQEEQQLM